MYEKKVIEQMIRNIEYEICALFIGSKTMTAEDHTDLIKLIDKEKKKLNIQTRSFADVVLKNYGG